MHTSHQPKRRCSQTGVALLIAIFTLLLIAVVAISLVVAAGNETSLSANYRSSTSAFYAAKAGLEEVRGRLLPKNPDFFNSTSPGFVPAVGGAPLPLHEVRYVLNPTGGENVLALYPDLEYDTEFGAGALGLATVKTIASVSPVGAVPGAGYKWVRINAITEASINMDVNGDHTIDAATLLYFDGLHLNLSATGTQALEVTSLAVLPGGTQKLLQYVVAPMPFALGFPGAVTASGTYSGATNFGDQAASFGISGTDFCNPAKQLYAVSGTNLASLTNLATALTPASNYPGMGGSAGPPPVASAPRPSKTFPIRCTRAKRSI
jgi:hypothetical protein